MTRQKAKNIKNIRHIALDMDGTIYCGKTLFPYTKRALELFEKCGIGYTYLTNNSSLCADAYIEKLASLGLKADKAHLYTSTMATLEYLQENFPAVKKIFVLGTESLKKEFEQAGYTVIREKDEAEPELVVAGFDTTLTYERLCKTAYWVKQGKPFIATHPDRICPTDQPTVLVDCGSICQAITAAAGIKPFAVLGKPSPRMLQGILKKHNLMPYQLAMVGDRLYTDIAMAEETGAFGVLVLSGESSPKDVGLCKIKAPLVVENILEFAKLLESSKKHRE